MRVHCQLKQTAFLLRIFQLAAENIEHRFRRGIGAQRLKAIHHEIRQYSMAALTLLQKHIRQRDLKEELNQPVAC